MKMKRRLRCIAAAFLATGQVKLLPFQQTLLATWSLSLLDPSCCVIRLTHGGISMLARIDHKVVRTAQRKRTCLGACQHRCWSIVPYSSLMSTCSVICFSRTVPIPCWRCRLLATPNGDVVNVCDRKNHCFLAPRPARFPHNNQSSCAIPVLHFPYSVFRKTCQSHCRIFHNHKILSDSTLIFPSRTQRTLHLVKQWLPLLHLPYFSHQSLWTYLPLLACFCVASNSTR